MTRIIGQIFYCKIPNVKIVLEENLASPEKKKGNKETSAINTLTIKQNPCQN